MGLYFGSLGILKGDGTPYKVFTPFYRKGCLEAETPRKPIGPPSNATWVQDNEGTLPLEKLNLLPKIRWDKKLQPHWKIGETGAKERLEDFFKRGCQIIRKVGTYRLNLLFLGCPRIYTLVRCLQTKFGMQQLLKVRPKI